MGKVAGYAAIIDTLELPAPLPHTLVLISKKTAVMKRMTGEYAPLKLQNNVLSEDELYEDATGKDFLQV